MPGFHIRVRWIFRIVHPTESQKITLDLEKRRHTSIAQLENICGSNETESKLFDGRGIWKETLSEDNQSSADLKVFYHHAGGRMQELGYNSEEYAKSLDICVN